MNNCRFCCLEKLGSATRLTIFSRGWSDSKAVCTELTVLVIGPAASCTSATQHTHCFTACSVLPTIQPSREKGYTQTHFAVPFVGVCYQSGLETTVNALCLVSDLFKQSFLLSKHIPNNNTCTHKSPTANIQNVSGENCHHLQERSIGKNNISITRNVLISEVERLGDNVMIIFNPLAPEFSLKF